jgi:hypothetical protein
MSVDRSKGIYQLPVRIEWRFKPPIGGMFHLTGSLASLVETYLAIQDSGVEQSMRIGKFAIYLYQGIVKSGRPPEEHEQMFEALWTGFGDLLLRDIDKWKTKADALLCLTYVLVDQRQMTYSQAADLASRELNKRISSQTWRVRLRRWAKDQGLPLIKMRTIHNEESA